MNKLPEDFKQKWIAALRSGEYKQGKNVMYDLHTDSYCCLGVAGIVCGASNNQMSGMFYFTDKTEGVPDEYPKVLLQTPALRGDFMEMNDTKGKSFSEIADYIEQNL